MFERYARQIALEDFGQNGQKNLQAAHILLIGAGGVASAILPLLVSAGVGKISIFDADKVSLTNLQRQTLFRQSQIGLAKAQCAKENFEDLNCDVKIEAYNQLFKDDLTSQNVLQNSTLCIDACDSFLSRTLVSKMCKKFGAVQIMAAAQGYVSQISVFAKGFYLDKILADESAEKEGAKGLAIFPPSAHLSGVLAAGYALEKIAQNSEFEAGLFMSFDFKTQKFFKTNFAL